MTFRRNRIGRGLVTRAVAWGLLACVPGCDVKSQSSISDASASATMAEQTMRVEDEIPSARVRTFQLDVGATLRDLPPEATVRIWMPVPPTDTMQTARRTAIDFPGEPQVNVEPKYGNRILFCETVAPESGRLHFSVSYDVERKEAKQLGLPSKSPLADARRQLFLAANAKVPVDGKPAALIQSLKFPEGDSLAMGRMLYDYVGDHMEYDKSRPGYGNGDAVWACNSRFGNCTDFHSLFISMARSREIPARFEIGFPLPKQRGEGDVAGYHCWAYFFADRQGWIPVDISEGDKHPELRDYYFGNLSENRVTMTVGRDLVLVPPQEGPALNFLVGPYVEVDSKPWPKEKMAQHVRFRDQ